MCLERPRADDNLPIALVGGSGLGQSVGSAARPGSGERTARAGNGKTGYFARSVLREGEGSLNLALQKKRVRCSGIHVETFCDDVSELQH